LETVVRKEPSVEGEDLIKVIAVYGEDKVPDVEAVFRVAFDSYGPLSDRDALILVAVSVTRRDTREPILVPPEELKKIHQAAVDFAAEQW